MIFSIFLFVLASVAANHKTATDANVLNKIAGLLKYAPDKTGAKVVERFEYLRIWTTLCENGSHYGSTIQFFSNFPFFSIQLIYTKTILIQKSLLN